MKRKVILGFFCICLASLLANARTYDASYATVYLNNGTVLTGAVRSADGKIVITVPGGEVLSYFQSEVHKIDYAGDTKMQPSGTMQPAEGFYRDNTQSDKGFYFTAESVTGYSMRVNNPNFGFEEVDLVGGYRFSTYLRCGIGFGARYYWNNSKVRYRNSHCWAMPLFVDLRGEFIPRAYRTVTPYWNFQTGASLGDGYLLRPAVGIRVGERRSAFLLALSYTGQSLNGFKYTNVYGGEGSVKAPKRRFVSFISLKIGYEF